MKLVVISGRSGSGKSTALQALEDVGFYCIDNLPATLLPELVYQMTHEGKAGGLIAVSVDARNVMSDLKQFPEILRRIKSQSLLSCELLFLDASEPTLLKRYSATRRKHPLSNEQQGLQEAIQYERDLLEPIADLADIRVDTTRMNLYELRDIVKLRVAQRADQSLSLQFESFGFKHGVPLDVDFTFDVRVLPNPYWIPELRRFSGLDSEIQNFLGEAPEVGEMIEDIARYLERWLPRFKENNRSYVTVGIGCTGGQHRSVYVAEQLSGYFRQSMDNVHIRHRELNR